MTVKRRKKSSRLHGSNTWTWGRNKHRGSGSRGGVGLAGCGKRSAHKRASVWKLKSYRGKHGFIPANTSAPVVAINVRDIEANLSKWVKSGSAKKDGDVFVIDLSSLGFTKLLSAGQVRHKFKIVVASATQRAVEKVKAAGGDLS